MSAQHFGLGYLLSMTGIVAFGAVVPIVPTGAAVSVGAVLGVSDHIVLLPIVVGFAAAGAYVGDLVVYAALRFFGVRLSDRVAWLHADARAAALERFQREIATHELRTLLLSRLVPGGRIPVLLAAALGGYPFRRYASADLGAAALWAVVYAALGLAGQSIFPEPWQGVLAAIVLVVVVSLLLSLWRRHLERAADGRPAPRSTS
ncbi:DedA family protein [Jatrophihabitans endophyticus]|uniref:DedA family protein n=1 Tax=Jatrophihabitans endophyticus TaxID=1206085 RepID=UPI001A108447|nr:VTT domain-containing protein [Jatrophihabitans endophyticus]MBE7189233.1 VTT domain-containing protein [Jatrophihabitans endophyticus]